jgi:hypothetical protein
MRLEGLDKLKESTSSGLELSNFRPVAECLNKLRYHVPLICVTEKDYIFCNIGTEFF